MLQQAEDPRAMALDHALNGNGVQTRLALEKMNIDVPNIEKQSTCAMM